METLPKVFIDNRSGLYNDLIPWVNQTTNLLQSKAYLTWNSSVQPQIRKLQLAKEHGIKSYVITHGVWGNEDHCDWIKDEHTPIHKMPFLADYALCWGKQDYEDYIKIGIPEERLKIVGYPGVWDSLYLYECKGTKLATSRCEGEKHIDPLTKDVWELKEMNAFITPRNPKPKWILYLPSHDTIDRHMIHTKKTWKVLKDMDNVLIKASSSYDQENGVFKDEMDYKYCGKCDKLKTITDKEDYNKIIKCECGEVMRHMPKVIYPNINAHDNLPRLRKLISESKVVIIDYCSTPNVLCHAIGTPVITLQNDYGLRKLVNNEWQVTYHDTPADIMTTTENLKQTIEDVLSGKIDKSKEQKEWAERLAGISYGFPSKNIRDIIK